MSFDKAIDETCQKCGCPFYHYGYDEICTCEYSSSDEESEVELQACCLCSAECELLNDNYMCLECDRNYSIFEESHHQLGGLDEDCQLRFDLLRAINYLKRFSYGRSLISSY